MIWFIVISLFDMKVLLEFVFKFCLEFLLISLIFVFKSTIFFCEFGSLIKFFLSFEKFIFFKSIVVFLFFILSISFWLVLLLEFNSFLTLLFWESGFIDWYSFTFFRLFFSILFEDDSLLNDLFTDSFNLTDFLALTD